VSREGGLLKEKRGWEQKIYLQAKQIINVSHITCKAPSLSSFFIIHFNRSLCPAFYDIFNGVNHTIFNVSWESLG